MSDLQVTGSGTTRVAAMNTGTAVNRRRWDALAERHGRGEDDYYDTAGFLAGASSLTERERSLVSSAIGDVAGRKLLHVQCHIGLDTLSWARVGAEVTGVDFSPVAIARARELSDQAGVQAEFVEADALALPPALAGEFDLVFASYGVLCWIGSVSEWMRSVAGCMCQGAVLVLIDIHPLVGMVETVDPLVVDFPYGGTDPVRISSTESYAVSGLDAGVSETVQYPHGLGEIVTAAAATGLRVESLTEWFDEDFDPKLVTGEDGRATFPFGNQRLPTSYGLCARRV